MLAHQFGEQRVDVVDRRRHGEARTDLTTHRETREVPRRVLAEIAHSPIHTRCIGTEMGRQQTNVFGHHRHHVTEPTRCGHVVAPERRHEIAEQPRTTQAAPTHDHTVTSGGLHHAQCIVGGPDVAVAEHGNRRDRLLQRGDGFPTRLTRVVLFGRACM